MATGERLKGENMLTWIKAHFQRYRERSPWGFCWRITIEGLVVTSAIAIILSLLSLPGRSFRLFDLVFLGVLVAPVIETLLLQALPIWAARSFKAGLVVQIAASVALFTVCHIQAGIATGIAAGLIGGFYFAFTYAHWREKSRWTAFWTTAVSHALHNGALTLTLIAAAAFIPSCELRQYDYHQLFSNCKIKFYSCSGGRYNISLWYFLDDKGDFLFAIGHDATNNQRMNLSPGVQELLSDDLLIPSFQLGGHSVTYADITRQLTIDHETYDLNQGKIFILSEGATSIRQLQVTLDAKRLKEYHQFSSYLLDAVVQKLLPVAQSGERLKEPPANVSPNKAPDAQPPPATPTGQ
jgi:hypothetical protein